jgi:hypothetical protein
MDLVVVFLLLCFIAWLRKLALCRLIGQLNPVGPPHQRVKTASRA